MEPSVAPDKKAERKPPAQRIEEAIMEIVRENIDRPPATKTEQEPTRKDAFWLFILICNLALIIWLIPVKYLEDSKLKTLAQLIPWIGTYAFVLGYSWSRNKILETIHRRAFRLILLVLLIIIIPISLSRFPIFPIKPVVEPANAKVRIDGNEPVAPNEVIVSMGHHTVSIVDSMGNTSPDYTLSFGSVFQAWLGKAPYWIITYPLVFTTDEEGIEVIIERADGDFTAEFLNNNTISTKCCGVRFDVKKGEKVSLHFYTQKHEAEGKDEAAAEQIIELSEVVNLPAGVYNLIAQKGECRASKKITIGKSKTLTNTAAFENICDSKETN